MVTIWLLVAPYEYLLLGAGHSLDFDFTPGGRRAVGMAFSIDDRFRFGSAEEACALRRILVLGKPALHVSAYARIELTPLCLDDVHFPHTSPHENRVTCYPIWHMEVTDDKPDLVLCLAERTLLRWQMRGLCRLREEAQVLDVCWGNLEATWKALKRACLPFAQARHFEVIHPLHRNPRFRKSLKIGFSPKGTRKHAEVVLSEYNNYMKIFRDMFKITTKVTWQMSQLLKELQACDQTIASIKKKVTLPMEVEAADVRLILCPDAVRKKKIQLLFAKGELTVCIQTIPLDLLLKRIKFGKPFQIWKRLNVVTLVRCDVRCEEPAYYSIKTKEQFDNLIEDLNG